MPWVGRYSLGDSTKVLCFFGAELYKITERCRGRRWFFALGGQVFVGRWHKSTVFFWHEIIQNYGVLAGKGVLFALGGLVFCWEIAQKTVISRCKIIQNYGARAGKRVIFCPGWAGFRREMARNRPVSARNRPKTPRFRPVLARFCLTFAPCFAKMGSKKIHKNPSGGETKFYIFVYLCPGGAVLGPGNRMPGSGPFAKEKKG